MLPFFWYLTITLAGGAAFSWHLAVVITFLSGDILVGGKQIPADCRDYSHFSGVNLQSCVRRVSGAVAVRTENHVHILGAARTAAAVVTLTNGTAHASTSFLSDQHQSPAHAKAMHPMTSMKSLLMMLITRHARLTNPNKPAKSVRKRLIKKPRTFIKALDTIVFI